VFFHNNFNILLLSSFVSVFLQSLASAVIVYMIIKIKSFRFSPWIGFGTILILGIAATAVNIFLKPSTPSIDSSGSVIWVIASGAIPMIYYVVRAGILLAAFIPLIFILVQQFKSATDANIKRRSLGLTLVVILGVIITLIDYFFIKVFGAGGLIRDIIVAVLSVLLFFVILLTQKPPVKDEN
jgi:hypothetical protein